MRNYLLNPRLIGVVAACVLWSSVPPYGYAMPTESSAAVATAGARDEQIERIMQVLARPQARWHLRLMGFNDEEVRTRLARLDDAQLASVAEQAEQVRGAGEAVVVIGISLGAVLLAALIILVVYLIVHESEKEHAKATTY